MAGQLREYRRRIRSVQSTKKITKAMELIAASRIAKARARVAAARPYAEEITRVIEAVASQSNTPHPLTTGRPQATRVAIVVITSDRGLAGGYSSNALKRAGELTETLRAQGKDIELHVVGRKGVGYYRFRGRTINGEYTGFSEQPSYADAKSVADALISSFVAGGEDGGVDEIHLVHTEYVSALTQTAVANRLLPMVLDASAGKSSSTGPSSSGGLLPQYEFEPSAEAVLDALLPRYVESRLYAALLESAASESAARQRAMKSATDNAEDLARTYTRLANRARQDAITQEISEIVGGANALASAS
ncbi:ATP synthase (subunit gamma, component F1) [Frankia sp. AiPs1]|uniref:F0F1 ATP synthase subunit gamma n=1 Tax=Frankia sp. AiPa1 TaxID=573492 RepID=UPI00202B6F31|nr:F0F1 ATP synthase subunit gamma [Frankia sp. AiPa1]MCL9759512.1 F0F1 ATP synthase subunit gamma [Frankia sp. AiPa1]